MPKGASGPPVQGGGTVAVEVQELQDLLETPNNRKNGRGRFQVLPVQGVEDESEISEPDSGSRRSSADMLLDSTYVYDSRYGKSLGQLTREVAPRAEHYRDLASLHHQDRPTLEELHEGDFTEKVTINQNGDQPQKKGKVIKFGWLEGVFMRCLLNIWGVMLFLRLSWVIGQAGIVEGLLLISLANIVTFITALSMSAVSTNGQIRAGGIYYMISRALGPEFGGAIGLMFTLANSIAVAMYIVGFCESVQDLMRTYGAVILDNGTNDIRVVGLITLAAILVLALVGMDWVTRTQMLLLVILVASQLDFMLGTFLGPPDELKVAKGFVGYHSETFQINLWSEFREQDGVTHNFFSVFAVFFPAVTGIVAGANLSGDLKDPSSAIPLGTLLAILTTYLSYITYAVMLGGCVLREATGNITDILPPGHTENDTIDFSLLNWRAMNCTNKECEYGLLNDSQAMELASAWGPLIYGGCFAATLSSAIASLVGAPRVLQALASDKLYPFIGFFAKGFGANNDPVRGYVLVFFISVGCILIGELNAIAPLLSNFFLAAYALINFSVFNASLSRTPGWRPAFKYFNAWISLFGSFLCVIVMFLMSWWTALITFLVVVTLYLYVSYRKPNVNWGSSTQAQSYLSALRSSYALNRVEEHVKNFRPQLLVLSGLPGTRPPLLDFASLLTRGLSLLVVAQFLQGKHSRRAHAALTQKAYRWMQLHKIKGFFVIAEDDSFEHAAQSLMQLCGLGKLRPNMLLMGYKVDWRESPASELKQYFHVIHEALDRYMAVGILRVKGHMDFSAHLEDEDQVPIHTLDKKEEEEKLRRNQSISQLSQEGSSGASTPAPSPRLPRANQGDRGGAGGAVSSDPMGGDRPNLPQSEDAENKKSKKKKLLQRTRSRTSQLYVGPGGRPLDREVLNSITQFQKKKKGNIDVWWLYDDGGLTLLLPHILTTRSQYSDCKMRVFSLANRKGELDRDQRNLAALLSKFRIKYSDVVLIPDITRKAQDSTKKEFESMLEGFRVKDNDDQSIDPEIAINDSEIIALKEKSNRHMRIREELLQHSKDSAFVVITLPMPRKGTVSAPLYMAWLELLTRGMPPSLVVRGNQTSVLTFYS